MAPPNSVVGVTMNQVITICCLSCLGPGGAALAAEVKRRVLDERMQPSPD